jgi:hypothetical protein
MNLVLGLGLLVVGWAVFTFNRLTRLRQLGNNAWADIDVQLKRRHDLIPSSGGGGAAGAAAARSRKAPTQDR